MPQVRPIIFSPPMVRAILAGKKRETRRVVTGKVALEWLEPGMFNPGFVAHPGNHLCPFGNPGDVLYVRERFAHWPDNSCRRAKVTTLYAADWSDDTLKRSEEMRRKYPDLARAYPESRWRPSIHMPRKLARLWLKLERVHCERLRSITEYEAILEGFTTARGRDGLRYCGGGTWVSAEHPSHARGMPPSAVAEFACYWDTLNAERGHSFASDPWVWAVRFAITDPVT